MENSLQRAVVSQALHNVVSIVVVLVQDYVAESNEALRVIAIKTLPSSIVDVKPCPTAPGGQERGQVEEPVRLIWIIMQEIELHLPAVVTVAFAVLGIDERLRRERMHLIQIEQTSKQNRREPTGGRPDRDTSANLRTDSRSEVLGYLFDARANYSSGRAAASDSTGTGP